MNNFVYSHLSPAQNHLREQIDAKNAITDKFVDQAREAMSVVVIAHENGAKRKVAVKYGKHVVEIARLLLDAATHAADPTEQTELIATIGDLWREWGRFVLKGEQPTDDDLVNAFVSAVRAYKTNEAVSELLHTRV